MASNKGPMMGGAKAFPIAREYVRLHNAASKEYKAAFKAVGARMWHGDYCHLLRTDNLEFITTQIAKHSEVPDYYIIHRPLTVLDSFPEVKRNYRKRKQLNDTVDEIWERYKRLWEEYKQLLKKEE